MHSLIAVRSFKLKTNFLKFLSVKTIKSATSSDENEILKKQNLRNVKLDQQRLKEMKEKMRNLHRLQSTQETTFMDDNNNNNLNPKPDFESIESPYILKNEDAAKADCNNFTYDSNSTDLVFINSLKNPVKRISVEPNVKLTAYGRIRTDTSPLKMELERQETNDDKVQLMAKKVDVNLFDEQYFNLDSGENVKIDNDGNTNEGNISPNVSSATNYFDDQYFGINDVVEVNYDNVGEGGDITSPLKIFETTQTQYESSTDLKRSVKKLKITEQKSDKFIASLTDNNSIKNVDVITDNNNYYNNKHNNLITNSGKDINNNYNNDVDDNVNYFDEIYFNQITNASSTNNLNSSVDPGPHQRDITETIKIEPVTRRQLKRLQNEIPNVTNPVTAYDAVVKMRMERKKKSIVEGGGMNEDGFNYNNNKMKSDVQVDTPLKNKKWNGPTDSKGFKILTDQVRDVQHMIDSDLVSMLCDSILFENEQILVIDKPYGLPSHGGPGVDKCIASLLDKMADRREKLLRSYKLVHRLDKETTGVMILAKTQQTSDILLSMFKKRQVIKTYWVITKGVPNPPEGKIDIPMAEGTVGNRYRMELRPIYTKEMRLLGKSVPRYGNNSEDGDVKEAITNYKVLSSNDSCALVECTPETGVKHQIRCHLSFALNTPVLGDHKYSHLSKFAPQKLPPDMLEKLGIRQAKVRHLAMHLHARSLVLPEFLIDGKNLFVSARLPSHFIQNMKWLKLDIPRK